MFKNVKLSELLNSIELIEVQAIFESWKEILRDSIENSVEYASSDECKRFTKEIENIKSDVELDETIFLNVILDIRQHHASIDSTICDSVLHKLIIYFFKSRYPITIYLEFFKIIELCEQVWSSLSSEQKECYYNDCGTIKLVENIVNLYYFDARWLYETDYCEILTNIVLARID